MTQPAKKILVLVLSADVQGYDLLIKAIRDTWGKFSGEHFKILYYYGHRAGYPCGPANVTQHGDILICNCEEALHNITHKTMLAYEYVYGRFEFDYTFRCCAGSYIVPSELHRFIEHQPPEGFYCGVIGDGDPPFASGSGYFLSRDLVGKVVRNGKKITSYGYPGCQDDVAMGRFMKEMGIGVRAAPRRDFSTTVMPREYHYHSGKNEDGKWMYTLQQKLYG